MTRQFISDLECTDGYIPSGTNPITALTSTNFSVLATSGTVVAANTSRRYLRIQNLGIGRVYLNCTSGTVKAAFGIRLDNSASNNSVFEINESKRYTGAIKGIAVTSGQRVSILQG